MELKEFNNIENERIRLILNILDDYTKYIDENNIDIDIEVDGGITFENVNRVKQAGANVIVAGSTVFNHFVRAEAIEKLRTL